MKRIESEIQLCRIRFFVKKVNDGAQGIIDVKLKSVNVETEFQLWEKIVPDIDFTNVPNADHFSSWIIMVIAWDANQVNISLKVEVVLKTDANQGWATAR